MRRTLCSGLFALASLAASACGPGEAQANAAQSAPPVPRANVPAVTVTVRQSGEADVLGDDDRALQAGLDKLKSGGTLVLGPGTYTMRRTIFLPKNLILRGEDGATLALPSPVLSAAAAKAGTKQLALTDAHAFVAPTRVQVLPPIGADFFADGATKSLELQQVERVEGNTLYLVDALTMDVPSESRIGYPHKVLQVNKEGLTTIENLIFEGGRIDSIPMPGHSQRCAIWSSAPFGYEEQRLGPPGHDVIVRRCRFTNWYGRAVAFYNQEDGVVEGCTIEHVHDEAIDLDHFVERFRIADNDVRDALWPIVLNDASRNLVEKNRIDGCEIGIWSWRYPRTPGPGLNEENIIRGNEVRGARDTAIRIDKTCVRYVVQDNRVQGKIVVVESDNIVGPNTELPPERAKDGAATSADGGKPK